MNSKSLRTVYILIEKEDNILHYLYRIKEYEKNYNSFEIHFEIRFK